MKISKLTSKNPKGFFHCMYKSKMQKKLLCAMKGLLLKVVSDLNVDVNILRFFIQRI